MDEMTIGDVARRAGLNTSAVRYYERIGLLPRARRVHRHRRYDAAVLRRLALIRFARESGFSLAEIRTLFDGFTPDTPTGARWRALAREKLPEIDALIERANQMKRLLQTALACECASLDDCAALIEARVNP